MIEPLLLPRFWPMVHGWIAPINAWLYVASPFGFVMTSMLGTPPRSVLIRAYVWMVGLQIGYSLPLILWAIVRLRPAARVLAGGDGRLKQSLGLKDRSWRLRPHPEIGDDPMLWKERYVVPGGRLNRILETISFLVLFALIGVGLYHFALPAFAEAYLPHVGTRRPDDARLFLNGFLRTITVALSFIGMIMIAGSAAEGIAFERQRETWSSLLATPLTAREILRAKLIGALLRSRVLGLTVLMSWLVGVAAGSVHPIGFAAVTVGAAAFTALAACLGTYVSLSAKDLPAATNRAVLPVLLLCAAGLLPIVLPRPFRSIFAGVISAPFVLGTSLLSYRDVRLVLEQSGIGMTASSAGLAGSTLPEPALAQLALVYLLGVMGATTAAVILWRTAIRRFDACVGRPTRPEGTTAPLEPVPDAASGSVRDGRDRQEQNVLL